MILTVIESPYAGDVQANIAYAKRCVLDCLKRKEAPYASHLFFTQEGLLNDLLPEERALGIEAGLAWGRAAKVVAVYIDRGISSGMLTGIAAASARGAHIEVRALDREVSKQDLHAVFKACEPDDSIEMRRGQCPRSAQCFACDRLGYHLEPSHSVGNSKTLETSDLEPGSPGVTADVTLPGTPVPAEQSSSPAEARESRGAISCNRGTRGCVVTHESERSQCFSPAPDDHEDLELPKSLCPACFALPESQRGHCRWCLILLKGEPGPPQSADNPPPQSPLCGKGNWLSPKLACTLSLGHDGKCMYSIDAVLAACEPPKPREMRVGCPECQAPKLLRACATSPCACSCHLIQP